MNMKSLEKANKILSQIKTLDAEIIEIDKCAMLVANGDVKIDFSLSVQDLAKSKHEDEKVKFDEDGSIVSPTSYLNSYMTGFLNPFIRITEEKKKDDKTKLSQQLSENCALQILGVLLFEKQSKRETLLNKLTKLGFAV